MKKIALVTLMVIPFVIGAAYTGWWFYTARIVKGQIGTMPQVTLRSIAGFPGEMAVSGSIKSQHIVNGLPHDIVVPDFTLRALPFYKSAATLTVPQGAYIDGFDDRETWSLDYLEIQGPLPLDLPSTLNSQSLSQWRDKDGRIIINHFILKKQDLSAEGAGIFKLDDLLQPTGQINARVNGHLEYIKFMVEKNMIDSKGAMLASTILGGLSNPSEGNGEDYMDIGISLRNRTLYAGPLAVAQVPEIDWDSDNQPVLHQLPDAGLPVSAQTYPVTSDHPPSELPAAAP